MNASRKTTPTQRHKPTFYSWHCMRNRCESPSHENYRRYGGRGITVCERWKKFENFLADMGERPKGKTLDRFPNNDGNYEPGNCRWATPKEQVETARRQRRNPRATLIEFHGEKLSSYGWAARMGIDAGTIRTRINVGWGIERALTTAPRR